MLPICVTMEFRKLRHSHLWLVFLVIPLIPTVMGAGNYLNNLGMLKSEWYSLWTQCSLFYSNFFYGPLIALYCAYIWRVEHLNHNWNQLMTMPVPVRDIFGQQKLQRRDSHAAHASPENPYEDLRRRLARKTDVSARRRE